MKHDDFLNELCAKFNDMKNDFHYKLTHFK